MGLSDERVSGRYGADKAGVSSMVPGQGCDIPDLFLARDTKS